MEKNTLVLIGVLAIMVLIAGIQLFQFNALTNSLNNVKASGTVAASSSPAPATTSSSGGNSNALANLPSQVGSC